MLRIVYLFPKSKQLIFGAIVFTVVFIGNIGKLRAYESLRLNLSLTVLAKPSCTIQNGNTITIPFGDVHGAQIDGVSYKRTLIDYKLVCTNLASDSMNMTVSWPEDFFDGLSVSRTLRRNFGIALYHDSKRLKSGDSIKFFYQGEHPSLYAVPIKPKGVNLSDGGQFYASMMLTITYL